MYLKLIKRSIRDGTLGGPFGPLRLWGMQILKIKLKKFTAVYIKQREIKHKNTTSWTLNTLKYNVLKNQYFFTGNNFFYTVFEVPF